MFLTFGWTTGLAYVTSSCLYQLGTIADHPASSLAWLAGSAVVSVIAVKLLRIVGRKSINTRLIDVVQVT